MKARHIDGQYIGIYENAFPSNYCDEIIDFFYKNSEYHYERQQNMPQLYNDLSLSIDHIEEGIKYNNYFVKILTKHIFPIYKHHFPFIPDYYKIDSFKLQRTVPGQGYHIWHSENEKYLKEGQSFYKRWAAYTLYLNDVKEGGETEFLHQHLRIKPTKGTLCIFPSYFTHTHRGNPPLSGEKYIITGWLNLVDVDKNGQIVKE